MVTLKMSKTDKSGFSKQLKVIFYCISSKNYQFVVEKFENLSKIHEQFFLILAIFAILVMKKVFSLFLSSTRGDSSGSVR